MVTAIREPITLDVLREHRDEILAIADSFGAEKVRVFGSVAKGRSTFTSDVDLLVRFRNEHSLFVRIGLIDALSSLLGAEVDVLTEQMLHPLLREEILQSAVPI